jgi:DNA repair protein RadC
MKFHALSHMTTQDLESQLLGTSLSAEGSGLSAMEQQESRCDLARALLLQRRLSAARELLLRGLRSAMAQGPIFGSPQDLKDWLMLTCAGLQHEVFLALYLDANHRLIAHEEVFRGTLTQTSVYPRELVKAALSHNAAAMAVAHNHPSGLGQPSRADECLTQTLRVALALVDVRLIDHLVVAADQCTSFAEQGLM